MVSAGNPETSVSEPEITVCEDRNRKPEDATKVLVGRLTLLLLIALRCLLFLGNYLVYHQELYQTSFCVTM